MKNVVPVRKALGVRTVFNILGPMLNPAATGRGLIGVYSEAMVGLMAHALHELGAELTLVVHCGGETRRLSQLPTVQLQRPSPTAACCAAFECPLTPCVLAAGLDELAPIAVATVATVTPSGVSMGTIDPFLLGFPKCTIEDLKGGSATENAAILRQVFSGQLEGPVTDTVILNAGAGLYVAGVAATVAEGCALAGECIKAGKPLAALDTWTALSQESAALS